MILRAWSFTSGAALQTQKKLQAFIEMSDCWWPTRPPTGLEAFCLFLVVRSFAAAFAPISDCDEVYNYWEPAHMMLEGYGFQTWEYRQDIFRIRVYDSSQICFSVTNVPYKPVPNMR